MAACGSLGSLWTAIRQSTRCVLELAIFANNCRMRCLLSRPLRGCSRLYSRRMSSYDMSTKVQQPQIARVIPAHFVASYQRRHVLIFNVVPVVGTLFALALLFVAPLSWF